MHRKQRFIDQVLFLKAAVDELKQLIVVGVGAGFLPLEGESDPPHRPCEAEERYVSLNPRTSRDF